MGRLQDLEGLAERGLHFLPHGPDSPDSKPSSGELLSLEQHRTWALPQVHIHGHGRAQEPQSGHFPRDMVSPILHREIKWCAQGAVLRESGESAEPGTATALQLALREPEGQAQANGTQATLKEPLPVGALVIKSP